MLNNQREIKFRAWSLIGNKNKMVYLNDGLLSDLQSIQNQWYIMQFTGFYDINNKEIYDKDITQRKNGNHGYYIEMFEWSNKGGWQTRHIGYRLTDGTLTKLNNHDYISYTINNNVSNKEIIGNLYETPKLLDEKC